MDIQRAIKTKPIWKTYWYIFPILALVTLSIAAKAFLADTSYIVSESDIQLAQVQQGEFVVEVSAIGQLKPESTQWIAASVAGRVEKLFVKPGTPVTAGQVLVQLSNPELHRSLQKAHWELQATEAEMKANIMQLESQLVDIENSVDEAEFNYQSTKLKLDAESELLKSGKGSISKIDYRRTSLSVEQQKQRWLAQKRRAKNMKLNIAASKQAQQARLALVRSNYLSNQLQVENLTVRAQHQGTIQTISLQLGQQVNIGESIATLANHARLIAELQVQELKVQEILVGQPVIIDTRSNELEGVVSRVDPRVNQGMVQVDVELQSALPAEARPDLNIEGRIIVKRIENTLFVRRPAFAPKNTLVDIFSLSADKQFLARKKVSFGESSVSQIQIISGLKAGEQIVTSDISKIIQHNRILIN